MRIGQKKSKECAMGLKGEEDQVKRLEENAVQRVRIPLRESCSFCYNGKQKTYRKAVCTIQEIYV